MINNIKLVSSFAHKDKSNVFSNVMVKNGIMTAQNEMTGISVKVDSDVDFCCNALRLNQVLSNCKDGIKTKIKSGKIWITSGKFKSNIEIIDPDIYPVVENSDSDAASEIDSGIINTLNSLTQFTEINDVRAALQGVALCDGYLKATNGHMAIKKQINPINGVDEVIIPSKSIQMMARANALIRSISVKDRMVFFNFDDGFLFSKTIDHKMPDIDRILVEMKEKTELLKIAEPIKSISSLCDSSRIIHLGKSIENNDGTASIDGFNLKESSFNADYLLKIIDVADYIDFSQYPGVCPFSGDGIVGAVAGVRR
jgi:DNA polymerase III sliding clamp (beta) subunit (PCNA family)